MPAEEDMRSSGELRACRVRIIDFGGLSIRILDGSVGVMTVVIIMTIIVCIVALGKLLLLRIVGWGHVTVHAVHAVHMWRHVWLWEWRRRHGIIWVPHHVLRVAHVLHVCARHLATVHHLGMLLVRLLLLWEYLGRSLILLCQYEWRLACWVEGRNVASETALARSRTVLLCRSLGR